MQRSRNHDARLPPEAPSRVACTVGLGLRFEILEEVLAAIDAGRRLPVDFFEIAPENFARRGGWVPASLARIARDYPIVSHGLTLSIGGTAPLDDGYLADVRALADELALPDHSDHLSFSDVDGVLLHELFPVPLDDAACAHVAARVAATQDALGRRLLLENISFYHPIVGGDLTEPDVFQRLVRETGCGVLLDVNNVFVNATNHGFSATDFVDAMPLAAVQTIHVAGHQKSDVHALLVDTHGAAVAPGVLDLLRHAVARVGPTRVVLERDNHVPPLAELLAEVALVRRACDDAIEEVGVVARAAVVAPASRSPRAPRVHARGAAR